VRVLLAWADPNSANHPAIPGLQEELEGIRVAFRPHSGLHVELQELQYATRYGLEQAIRAFRPHILHFTGHGDRRIGGSVLVLNGGERGAETTLAGPEFAAWLQDSPIRLVTLAACYSACGQNSVAEALAQAGTPAVIGMQLPQRPAAAVPFARALYGALLQSASVETAVRQAREAVQGHGPDWGIPALFLSGQGSDLFPIHTPSPFTVGILRNPRFVGHSELLNRLHTALTNSTSPHVSLVGLGGTGKSQLAAEYAHSQRESYPSGVFWIDAENYQRMQQGYAALGRHFQLPDQGSERECMDRVIDRLQDLRGRALLVLDNVTAEIGQLRLPATGPCAVLVTTRAKSTSPFGFQVLPIPPLDETSAVALVQASRSEIDAEELTAIRGIVRHLGQLPLALALVSHRVDRLHLSFSEALAQLESPVGRIEWLKRARKQFTSATGHDGNIYRAIELSYAPLDPTARCVLSAATCFAGQRMPAELLQAACDSLDGEEYREALADLAGLSLVTRGADGRLSVHDLVRDFAWLLLDEPEQSAVTRKIASLLTSLLQAANENQEWRAARQELSHCYAAVQRCAETEQHVERQALLQELGRYHVEHRDSLPALGHLRDSLFLAEKLYGRRHIRTANALMWFGFAEDALGHSPVARTSLEEALSIAQEVLPPGDAELAEFHNGLGYVLKWAGALDAADTHYHLALAIAEKAFGRRHATVAMCLNNLGSLQETREDLLGAQERYREALTIDTAVFVPGHYKLSIRMNNLGRVLAQTGEPDEAAEWHRRALQIAETEFGVQHLHAGMSRYFLAEALWAQNDRRKAGREYQQAIAILTPIRGEDAPICKGIRSKLRQLEEEGGTSDN
jgi:tetratricopeptide (TPR) repeat protein